MYKSSSDIQWYALSAPYKLESTVPRRYNSTYTRGASQRHTSLRGVYDSLFAFGASIHSFSKVYVDALGTTTTYEAYLSSLFPGIDFTVTTKADSKFKIVGAASVAAKVTRDACVEGWFFEENIGKEEDNWSNATLGSGYPSGLTI